MLVLARKLDNSVMIGDDIEVKILSIRGGMVRLGIAAPKDVAVHRKEVYERMKAEQEGGSGADLSHHRVGS